MYKTKYSKGGLYFFKEGDERMISPWFDIPLKTDNHITMVCEVPKGTRIKYEVSTDDNDGHPIRRDTTSDGHPRSYPFNMPWNYGMIPRTYEDPNRMHMIDNLKIPGDGDPLDVIDISERKSGLGEVYGVKVFGALALIDGGELDWKLVAARADSKAVLHEETLEHIKKWFIDYKPGSGNTFAYDGKLMPHTNVIKEANAAFKDHVTNLSML